MLIRYTCGSNSQTLRMRNQFQCTGRPISHRNGWSFSRLHDTVARLRTGVKFSPGTRTGVNSRRGDSRRHDILWWYHVNKCRAMRGNRSELAPARKSPWCHVNTPLLDPEMTLPQNYMHSETEFCEVYLFSVVSNQ